VTSGSNWVCGVVWAALFVLQDFFYRNPFTFVAVPWRTGRSVIRLLGLEGRGKICGFTLSTPSFAHVGLTGLALCFDRVLFRDGGRYAFGFVSCWAGNRHTPTPVLSPCVCLLFRTILRLFPAVAYSSGLRWRFAVLFSFRTDWTGRGAARIPA